MRVSKAAYEQGKLMLKFIQENPMSDLKTIAEAVGALKVSAQPTIKRMVEAGVLETYKQKLNRGYQLLYKVTGKEIPERQPIKKYVPPNPAIKINTNAVPAESLIALPSFIRAITPVVEAPASPGAIYNGHTKEQHIQQSSMMRQERRLRGAIYSGESRYDFL